VKAKITQAAPVLKAIHDVSSTIAGACALATLAVVTAEITGPCAAAFGVVTAVTGAGLYVAGKESGTGALWDVATAIPGLGVLKNAGKMFTEGRAAARWFSAAERYAAAGKSAAADISFDVYLGRYIGQRAALKMFDTFDGIQTVFGGFNIAGGFLWGENASQAC